MNSVLLTGCCMSGEIKYWPLLMGWTIVTLLLLYGWKRQAIFAAAGMLIVSYAVLSAGLGW
ncbi:hypothetical protein MNBD_GAMMA13-1475 [hydrothermal vent metagenome]|uniref:Uncharacterized protein n=1 Tax=hydrothermal vent metagenome TaxID=652676 RepID=A0A3B0Z167_9ZZZZ